MKKDRNEVKFRLRVQSNDAVTDGKCGVVGLSGLA